jgi:hypothetical protein
MCQIDQVFTVSMERQVTGANAHTMRNLLFAYRAACDLDNLNLVEKVKVKLLRAVRPPLSLKSVKGAGRNNKTHC